MATRLSLSYYPWISQTISGAELAGVIAEFVELLQAQLGGDVRIELLKEMAIPVQLNELKKKPTAGLAGKIGLLNPLGYALAHQEVPDIKAVAVVLRKIESGPTTDTYKSQLYTHRKTGIKEVKQAEDLPEILRGRSLAFGSPHSTSSFLVPAAMLRNAGIHPLNGFSHVEISGGHDKAAIAVYEGRVEVGAGHDGVISDLAKRPGYGDADQILTRIVWSNEIKSDPIALNVPDTQLRERVTTALLRIAQPNEPDSPGNKVVERFWGTKEGFKAVSPDAYEPLFSHMKDLGLRPSDLLS